MLNVKAERVDGCLVLVLVGELACIRQEDLLQRFVADFGEGCRHIILDLSCVPYVDSAAIGTLVELRSRAAKRGGEVVFVGQQGAVRNIFSIVRFDQLFRSFATVECALSELGSPPA